MCTFDTHPTDTQQKIRVRVNLFTHNIWKQQNARIIFFDAIGVNTTTMIMPLIA